MDHSIYYLLNFRLLKGGVQLMTMYLPALITLLVTATFLAVEGYLISKKEKQHEKRN